MRDGMDGMEGGGWKDGMEDGIGEDRARDDTSLTQPFFKCVFLDYAFWIYHII